MRILALGTLLQKLLRIGICLMPSQPASSGHVHRSSLQKFRGPNRVEPRENRGKKKHWHVNAAIKDYQARNLQVKKGKMVCQCCIAILCS